MVETRAVRKKIVSGSDLKVETCVKFTTRKKRGKHFQLTGHLNQFISSPTLSVWVWIAPPCWLLKHSLEPASESGVWSLGEKPITANPSWWDVAQQGTGVRGGVVWVGRPWQTLTASEREREMFLLRVPFFSSFVRLTNADFEMLANVTTLGSCQANKSSQQSTRVHKLSHFSSSLLAVTWFQWTRM